MVPFPNNVTVVWARADMLSIGGRRRAAVSSSAASRRRCQAFDPDHLAWRMPRPLTRPVEQVAPPVFLRVVGVFDLEPSGAQVIRIGQAFGDDAFEIVGTHQLEQFAPARDV